LSYIGRTPILGNFVKLDTITTSATTTFNLLNGGVAYFPQSANNCLVSLNGILQAPTDSYTISGSTIIFSNALTTSDVIDFIIVLGDVLNIGTPSDNTVSLAKLTASGTKDATTFLRGDNTFATPAGGVNTPAFFVKASTTQNIAYNTETKLTFGTELIDTDNAFSSGTFTVPTGKSGKYVIFGSIHYVTSNDFDNFQFRLYKNGSTIYVAKASNFNQDTCVLNVLMSLTAGDTLEAYTYHNYSPSALNTNDECTWFGGYKIIE